MNKNKKGQTTLIEKMGFNDKDFKTSKHDEICLWLANKDNVIKMINDLKLKPFIIRKYYFDCDNIEWDFSEHKPKSRFTRDVWGNKKDFISLSKDEIDILKNDFNNFLTFDLKERFNLYFERVISSSQSSFVVGFLDLFVEFKSFRSRYFRLSDIELPLCIEVKSVMSSFGEIVREINYYRQFQKGIYIVVAPDCAFEKELLEQNIYFYKYNR